MKYLVIGLDGWECGPFTLEEINRSIGTGLFNLNCLVKESDGGRWRRAREIAGVAGSGIPVAMAGGKLGFPGTPAPAVELTELRRDDLTPFIHRYLPRYVAVGDVWTSFWGVAAGSVTLELQMTDNPHCVILLRDASRPIVLGAAFPINGRGWLLIPPAIIGRVIRAAKPLPQAAHECLGRLYERLSNQLYLEGEACGLVKFTNGAGIRVDMKEQRGNLSNVLHKVTFLKQGSFSESEYDPFGDCPWPDDTGVTSLNYGAKRDDGWSCFNVLVQEQPPDLRDY